MKGLLILGSSAARGKMTAQERTKKVVEDVHKRKTMEVPIIWVRQRDVTCRGYAKRLS